MAPEGWGHLCTSLFRKKINIWGGEENQFHSVLLPILGVLAGVADSNCGHDQKVWHMQTVGLCYVQEHILLAADSR